VLPGNRLAALRYCATVPESLPGLHKGWLRKNGVAYSESTTITEYWDRVLFPNGDVWLIVTSILSDPRYLLNDYTRSAHFKREPDGSKWRPTPCRPA
jgi:hypothetical protein